MGERESVEIKFIWSEFVSEQPVATNGKGPGDATHVYTQPHMPILYDAVQ